MKKNQCEGWRRYGGIFTLGPVKWKRCESVGVVLLKVRQTGVVKRVPACQECWNECIKNGIEIIEATPIIQKKKI